MIYPKQIKIADTASLKSHSSWGRYSHEPRYVFGVTQATQLVIQFAKGPVNIYRTREVMHKGFRRFMDDSNTKFAVAPFYAVLDDTTINPRVFSDYFV